MNELEIVEQNMLAEVAPFEVISHQLQTEAENQGIANDEDLKQANDIKKRINAHSKLVKEKRLEITRPVNNIIDQIIAREKEVLQPLEEGKRSLGGKILAYEEKLEMQRAIETQRVYNLTMDIALLYRPGMTEKQVEAGRIQARGLMAELSEADRENSQIKLALMTLSNKFTERINDIEVEKQRTQKKKLEDDEARIERERRELRAKMERQKIADQQLEADKAAAKAERERPKSNIVEVNEFEIYNADAVPREYCSPDMIKIRAAFKNPADYRGGVEIPGVRILQTKKVR